ncbi:unnamed protein product [Linum trigynum]|uniref:Retrotransposon gag domain-containing protein n=1 Tax=Linum trigynum TaxID=586398 RepID=A0AAV2F831_9ROSI
MEGGTGTTRWTRSKGPVDCDPTAVLFTEQGKKKKKKTATVAGVGTGDDPAMAEKENIAELLRTMLAQQNATIQTQLDNLNQQLTELRTTTNAPVPLRNIADEALVANPNPNQGNDGDRQLETGPGNNLAELRGIKLQLPPFSGSNNAFAFLDWERKVMLFFQCGNYSEAQKVLLVTYEFTNYAAQWWEQTRLRRRWNLQPKIMTWGELRGLMRERFVPGYDQRELHETLQGLRQGSRSVEEYFREFELLMMRADVREDREATIARFLYGLNRELRQEVELRAFIELEEVVHLAVKVERQLKLVPGRRNSPANKTNTEAIPNSASLPMQTEAEKTAIRNPQLKWKAAVLRFSVLNAWGVDTRQTNARIGKLSYSGTESTTLRMMRKLRQNWQSTLK